MQEIPLDELAEKVSRKKQVFFYFSYRSSSIYSFQQNLAMAGSESCAVCLFPEMMASASCSGPDTLAFCKMIEHVETTDMTPLFELLHRRRAETILFGSEDSGYADCVDSVISTDDEGGILSNLIRIDLLLLSLSETFRRNYL